MHDTQIFEKIDHQFLDVLYLVTRFLRVTVSLLCRLKAVSKIHVPMYPYLINEGRLLSKLFDLVTGVGLFTVYFMFLQKYIINTH